VRDARRAHHLLARRVRVAEDDVVVDRVGEEERVLRHDRDVAPVVAEPHCVQVVAVDEDRAARRPVERSDQRNERALA